MDAALTRKRTIRHPLLVAAFAPIVPQLLGGAVNLWYNMVIIDPLLRAADLRQRFISTVIVWNATVYPIAVAIWCGVILSLRPALHQVLGGEAFPEKLEWSRRRLVNLPWYGAWISAIAWLLCIPVFLISLALTGRPVSVQLLWHLPISFCVSGFIAISQSFFLIELASHWALFPVFFRNIRPDLLKGIHPISLRTRGLMWAISAGICPIGSLLLLIFAPASPGTNSQWFGLFVGMIGIAFGLCSAVLIGRSVTEPVRQLRVAAQAVKDGHLDVQVPLRRADEFGELIAEFNLMVTGLREKENLRQTFGLHVGQKVAKQILARDPGLGGTEQEITVMFVDIRSFTERSLHLTPGKAVRFLNEFLRVMVKVVEDEHGGMINKFLGDGFVALFGVDSPSRNHADLALAAGRSMQGKLEELNAERAKRGDDSIEMGIGINTGPAIVGSIGSAERMEFTAIGNTVNVASRIEGLNKIIGTSLLISKATRDALERAAELRTLPPQRIKGVGELVEVFTPVG
jgi:adenylate cyclase